MDKFKLDPRELNILVKELQLFAINQMDIKLSESHAAALIDYIVSKTEYKLYNQAARETRQQIQEELAYLLGLDKSTLN